MTSRIPSRFFLKEHRERELTISRPDPAHMRYFDMVRHWTKKIQPHLNDEQLNDILVRDKNPASFRPDGNVVVQLEDARKVGVVCPLAGQSVLGERNEHPVPL